METALDVVVKVRKLEEGEEEERQREKGGDVGRGEKLSYLAPIAISREFQVVLLYSFTLVPEVQF